jgi:hypothetical protein
MEDPVVGALREARLALDEVVEEVQQVPGFEDFLATPSFDDVAQAAGQVLSACETLPPGTELLDEVVALPTELLAIGPGAVR